MLCAHLILCKPTLHHFWIPIVIKIMADIAYFMAEISYLIKGMDSIVQASSPITLRELTKG